MSSNVSDLQSASALMRTGGRILIQGAGTAADWAGTPSTVDTVLVTTELTGLVAYNPADMTIAVRAGTPLRAVQARLAEHRQWIANDAARVDIGATVGGLLATADAGPRQHLYGPLRDLVLGVTVVLANGDVVRSGGHVIKNVAGYDLAKLFSGSFGTLGLIAEVVLRTHPLPAASRTLVIPADAETADRIHRQVRESGVEPTALVWSDSRLMIRFEGTDAGIAAQIDRLGLDAPPLDAKAETATWQADAELVRGVDGETVVRIGTLPSRFLDLVELVEKEAPDAVWSASLAAGIHTLILRGADAPAVVSLLHKGFGDAAITVQRRADGVDAWGPPPRSVGVLRAVKHAFDPDGRLGPGRFAPWM